jgi:hypothetical protein
MANPTCLDIIKEALEELRARGLGETPEAIESTRGLTRLQAMWNAGVEQGLFGRVEEYLATGDYEAEEGQRVFADGNTITLPTTVTDDNTGLDRRPRDLAMIQVVDEAADPEISIYDAHEAAWTRIDNLTLNGDCPFGRRYRHGLVAALAVCMGPLFMKQAADVTQAYAGQLKAALGHRLSAPRVAVQAEYF